MNLHNRYLYKDRHILIHSGGEIKDSSGCLLIGDKLDIDDKGNIMRISRNHTHKIASNFMAFLMQRDIRDTNTNKFRHLSAKNNHKIEIPNINIVIRNEFGNVEKSKRVRVIDKLSIRFNGKELQILENGEITNKTFTISPFALSNPKELIKESRDYILDIKNIPAFITPDYKYILSMQDKNNNIATITNKNTKNIINAEIFLDDMFADFARILSNYKTAYNVSEVRVEVGYGKSEIDLRGQTTPNGGKVEWISQEGDKYGCYNTSKAILLNAGLGDNAGKNNNDLFQLALEKYVKPIQPKTVKTKREKMLDEKDRKNPNDYLVFNDNEFDNGIAYLDSELEAGYPIMVGIDHTYDTRLSNK